MMNKCEELQQIINEGNILKSSAKMSMIPNNFGYLTQALAVDTAELLKWNTKIDLLLKKYDNPVRNPKNVRINGDSIALKRHAINDVCRFSAHPLKSS